MFRTTVVLFMSVCGGAPYSSPLGDVATRAAAQHCDADVGDRAPRGPTEAPRGHAYDVSFLMVSFGHTGEKLSSTIDTTIP